jgi:DNA-binding Lrp family transcriptional regulator
VTAPNVRGQNVALNKGMSVTVSPAMRAKATEPITLDDETREALLQSAFYKSDEQRYTIGMLGDTIKGIKVSKEEDRMRALRAFSVRGVFSNSIVEEALAWKGDSDTRFYNIVGRHLPQPKLQYKSMGVSPHLDLELRCAVALLGGDECITLLLDNEDRHIIRPGALAAHGTHFIHTVHHMLALGMFMEERIKLQASSLTIRSQGLDGIRGKFYGMCGALLEHVDSQIRRNRNQILRRVGARDTIEQPLPERMSAAVQDPASSGLFSTVFRKLNEVKRMLQIVHDQAAGLAMNPSADAQLASKKHRRRFITTDTVQDFALTLQGAVKEVRETLFPDQEMRELFVQYYTMVQLLPFAGGAKSRFMTRNRYWSGIKFHLMRNPFLVTEPVTYGDNDEDYDTVTNKSGSFKPLKPGEAQMYYEGLARSSLRVLHRDIEAMCNAICDLGMYADILMEVGCLHCMMEASLLHKQPIYQSTMHAVSEGRRRIAKRVKLSEAKERLKQLEVLTRYGRVIDKKDALQQDVRAGVMEKSVPAAEDELMEFFKEYKDGNEVLDNCFRAACVGSAMEDRSLGVQTARRGLLFHAETRGCANADELTPAKRLICKQNVTRVPTFALFWPNMAERTHSYEICQQISKQNRFED